MAVTLADTYTDTDGTLLTDHDPDVGDPGSWGALAVGIGGTTPNDDLTITNNRVQTVNSGSTDAIGAICRNSTDPGADEYNIDDVMRTRSATQNNRYTALLWRMTPTGTSDSEVDRYLLLLNGSAGEWQLYKTVSGSLTSLGSNSANYAASTTYDVHVEVRSSGTTMAVSVDDRGGGGFVEILTSTDTDITQRGRVGVSTNRSGDGDIWFDTLTVDSVTSGTPVGQVTETDLAQPIGAAKARTLGQAAETDSAQSIGVLKTRTLGQPAETDLAQPVTALKTRTLGLATETDQALPITGRKTKTLGLAVETDTALALVIAAVADPNPLKLSFTEPARHVTHAESAHVSKRERSRRVTFQEG